MGRCIFCGSESSLISEVLEICQPCIFNKEWDIVKNHVLSVHEKVRKIEELPGYPPVSKKDSVLKCNLCVNECSLSENDTSYCGLRNIQKKKNVVVSLGF